jgi:hypothetical protein
VEVVLPLLDLREEKLVTLPLELQKKNWIMTSHLFNFSGQSWERIKNSRGLTREYRSCYKFYNITSKRFDDVLFDFSRAIDDHWWPLFFHVSTYFVRRSQLLFFKILKIAIHQQNPDYPVNKEFKKIRYWIEFSEWITILRVFENQNCCPRSKSGDTSKKIVCGMQIF